MLLFVIDEKCSVVWTVTSHFQSVCSCSTCQVSRPAFPTDTETQHKFLNSACRQYQSLQTFGFWWKDLLPDWISMNSDTLNLNRAKLDWTHLWTFSGHLACLCTFYLFFYMWCLRFYWKDIVELYIHTLACVGVSDQMYFTLSCFYANFGEKYCRRRGPILTLSCTTSRICSIHQVVSRTFVCVYMKPRVKWTVLVVNGTFH